MLNNPYMNTHTKVLCVIGHPIGHSLSPAMHNAALQEASLDYIYLAFDVLPQHLEKAVIGFKKHEMKGINVTIPHKETIIKYLDHIDPLAKKIGAVNTIKNENGYLIGKNTDAFGAKQALINAGFEIKKKKVLILGAGGAARAVSFALSDEIDKIFIFDIIENKAKGKRLRGYVFNDVCGTVKFVCEGTKERIDEFIDVINLFMP